MANTNGLKHLDTTHFVETENKFKSGIKEFEQLVRDMQSTTNDLLDSWQGKGRNRFETEYTKLKQQMTDISDTLYDIYDALVDADTAYLDTDEEVGKSFSMQQ